MAYKVLVSLLLLTTFAAADTVLLDFESLLDGTAVGGSFPSLTFVNAIVLTAGISVNEFEFPPRSGQNLVFDDSGPVSIQFANPVGSFSGYFTYLTTITLTAFDTANATIGSVHSGFTTNLGLSGEPGSEPNEFLTITSALGISSVTIEGHLGGGSFTMDDVGYQPLSSTEVPEPSTASLVLFALGALWLLYRQHSHGN